MRFTLPLLLSSAAMAATITASTPGNTFFNGLPVDATATFIVGTNQLTVIVTNLEANPTAVVQNISDIGFAFADPAALDAPFTGGTLVSGSGVERAVAANGTYSDAELVSAGWALAAAHQFDFGAGILLDLLGTSTAPEHTILGPPGAGNTYSNANGSIAGNKPHNPFLAGPVTFVLTVPGLTPDSVLLGAEFSFGTAPGYTVDAVPEISKVPEPGPLGLAALALVLGVGLSRRAGRTVC